MGSNFHSPYSNLYSWEPPYSGLPNHSNVSWALICCKKELGSEENTKSSGSGNNNFCITYSFAINLPSLCSSRTQIDHDDFIIVNVTIQFLWFLDQQILQSVVTVLLGFNEKPLWRDILLCATLAFWDMILKYGYRDTKEGERFTKIREISPHETRVLQQHGSLQNFGEFVNLNWKTSFLSFT